MSQPDKKALKILFNIYDFKIARYDSKTNTYTQPTLDPADFEYAKNAGVMFSPIILSHDEIINWVIKDMKSVALVDVSNAFLASLSTRRLDWRAALAGYAWGLRVRPHQIIKPPAGWYTPESEYFSCALCCCSNMETEYDLSHANYARFKHGGLRGTWQELVDPAFYLAQFAKDEKVIPTKEDYKIFSDIIGAISALPKNARARDIEKAIAKLFKSSVDEREVLIETLGYCSILESPEHKGYLGEFTPRYDRNPPARPHTNDWRYPVSWWRGEYGINKEALDYFFPQDKIR